MHPLVMAVSLLLVAVACTSVTIGITYDAATREVWVSNYSGTIQVFYDAAPS